MSRAYTLIAGIACLVGGVVLLTYAAKAAHSYDFVGAGLLAAFGCVYVFGGVYLIKRNKSEQEIS